MKRSEKCPICGRRLIKGKRFDTCPNDPHVIQKNLKRSPLKKVSTKRAKELRVYSVLKKEFLKRRPYCEVFEPCCTRLANDVHHVNGREGKRLLDVAWWLPVCRTCHDFIHSTATVCERSWFSKIRDSMPNTTTRQATTITDTERLNWLESFDYLEISEDTNKPCMMLCGKRHRPLRQAIDTAMNAASNLSTMATAAPN